MACIKFNKNISSLPLSVIFIDKYLPKANATYVKIYIYALRHSFSTLDFGIETIAKDLEILESDVINAFEYWKEKGVINFYEKSGEYFVEFLELDKDENSENSKVIDDKKKPRYSSKEVCVYMENDKSVKNMYSLAEKILARPLSTTEITTIFSFYDWLKLPKDVILMIIEHCASLSKTSIRYIEKVAISWAENEINTVAKAKKYIEKLNKAHALTGKIKSILQIGERKFTETELKYINTWINEYKVTEDVVKKAYDITIVNTSKLSYPYLNKILKSWCENGGEFASKASNNTEPPKKGFNNYSEERNLTDFEKQMLKMRMDKKGGN